MRMNLVHQTADEIVTAREFNPDYNPNDYCRDNGLTPTESKAAKMEAARIWRGAQVSAGVNCPISDEERVKIYKDMERE